MFLKLDVAVNIFVVIGVEEEEKPFMFSTNWQIYRLSHSPTEVRLSTRLPQKRSRTKLWIAFGVSMLSIATYLLYLSYLFTAPELVDVSKLMTFIGNKLTGILELVTRTLSSI